MSALHVVSVIDSLVHGGTEKSVAEMLPALARLGVEVTVVQLVDRGGFRDDVRAAGIEVRTLANSGRSRRIGELRTLLRELDADLVHTQLFEADVVGRTASALARTPVVSSLVNLSYGPEHAAAPGIDARRLLLARLADAGTARLVRRFHAVSEDVRNTMAERLHLPVGRIVVIPRGRRAGALGRRAPARAQATRAQLGIDARTPVVLAVGRHEWQKGLDVLLRSLPLLSAPTPGVVLVAGREGAQTAALEQLCRVDTDWSVRFLGARDDVGDLLAAADVLAFPSRWEGLPGTLIEALALETPIVASDIRPNAEVIGGLPGVRLVPPDAPDALAAALTAVIVDPPDVSGHRRRFEVRYEMDAVAQQMRALYDDALDDG